MAATLETRGLAKRFGSTVAVDDLTMPLWAIVLLHYWRAVGEGRRGYWLPLAIEMGLLLLTTYIGLILVGLLVLFTLANKRARAALTSYDPLIAVVIAGVVMGPHLIWAVDSTDGLMPVLLRLRTPEAVVGNLLAWLRQIGLILAAHAGLLVLVALVVAGPLVIILLVIRASRKPEPRDRRRDRDGEDFE